GFLSTLLYHCVSEPFTGRRYSFSPSSTNQTGIKIVCPDFLPITLTLIWRYRERRSLRLPFDAVTAVPPEETIFYAAKLTSNDPVLSRINPITLRTRPSAMRG